MEFEGIQLQGIWRYKPQAKQRFFHNAIVNRAENGFRDFLYGGAAKGGKSESLRWEAHRNNLQYPRLRGLLVRSSFPELERTHLTRIGYDLPSNIGHYNQQKHVFNYFNDSALEFGYGDREEDFKQYLSAEYDFILIDELTTIPFDFSFKLRSRLAASRKDFIPFWACATNPGDIAHVDVRNYFVKKTNIDPERFSAYNKDEVFFLPATVYDNQILLDRDPDVLKRLKQMSKRDQQKYLFGNWDIFEGQFFDKWFDEVHIIKHKDYLSYEDLKHLNIRLGLDYGNVTTLECLARDYNGNVVLFDELHLEKATRSDKIAQTVKFLKDRGLENCLITADTNMWIKDAFDVNVSNTPAYEYINAGLRLVQVSKSSPQKNKNYRIVCNETFKDYLDYEMNDAGIVTEQPKFKVYHRCEHFRATFPALITDKKNDEDIAQNQEDHDYDACKYALMSLAIPRQEETEDLNDIAYPSQHKQVGFQISDPQLLF